MIKTPKIKLLFLMLIQAALMPVSQANTAQHDHSSVKSLSTEIDSIIGSADKHISVGVVQSNITTQRNLPLQNKQCARQYSDKGRCGSSLCISISVALSISTPVELYKPEGNYLSQDYPLHSIFITPPFRPPIG